MSYSSHSCLSCIEKNEVTPRGRNGLCPLDTFSAEEKEEQAGKAQGGWHAQGLVIPDWGAVIPLGPELVEELPDLCLFGFSMGACLLEAAAVQGYFQVPVSNHGDLLGTKWTE
jgi:hypothetical protein